MSKNTDIARHAATGRFVLGRESFSKISAVEGLKMPKSMRGDFRAFDKENTSARKRREMLSGKYGR